jgi:hypothetical protein
MISKNQLNAQIKLTPLERSQASDPMTTGTFIGDAPRTWNLSPAKKTGAKSLKTATKEIRLIIWV